MTLCREQMNIKFYKKFPEYFHSSEQPIADQRSAIFCNNLLANTEIMLIKEHVDRKINNPHIDTEQEQEAYALQQLMKVHL